MSRVLYIALGLLAVLGFIATVTVAVASSVVPRLARGPAHVHAIGWAAVSLGVAFLCGATQSAWKGSMDLDNYHVHRRRKTVRFTAAEDPGRFAGYLVFYYSFGIAAILFGIYHLRHL